MNFSMASTCFLANVQSVQFFMYTSVAVALSSNLCTDDLILTSLVVFGGHCSTPRTIWVF